MISKTYNVSVKLTKKMPDGQNKYYDLNTQMVDSESVSVENNNLWPLCLSDGKLSQTETIDNGRKITMDSNGPVDIMDSYVEIDGNEFYALTYLNTQAKKAFVYERKNESYVYREYVITNNKITYIDNQLISIANINGCKTQLCTHSGINTYLQGLTSDMDIYEACEPFYFNENKFVITTQYFPVHISYKAFGYDTVLQDYIDLSPYEYKIIKQTGEVIFDKANISSVKIFYFVTPGISYNSNPSFIGNSSNQFVNITSNPNKSYMEYDISSTAIQLSTQSNEDITLTCNVPHDAIESNSNIIVSGTRAKKFYNSNIYTISPSYDIYDNVYETDSNLSLNSNVDDINVAIFGLFNTPNGKVINVMATGVPVVDPGYLAIATTPGVDTYQTILHTTNAAHPPELNGQISYEFIHNFDTNGYQFKLPAWANLNTIIVTEIDGIISSPFTNFTVEEPDVLIFNRNNIDLSKTYKIQFDSFVSPIISYVDAYTKRAHINTAGDIFEHYTTLESLYILSKNKIQISFVDSSEIYTERYFDNSIDITLSITQDFIKASLPYYKALILGI